MGVSGKLHASAALTPPPHRYLVKRSLGEIHSQSECITKDKKRLSLPRFKTGNVKPVAFSLYRLPQSGSSSIHTSHLDKLTVVMLVKIYHLLYAAWAPWRRGQWTYRANSFHFKFVHRVSLIVILMLLSGSCWGSSKRDPPTIRFFNHNFHFSVEETLRALPHNKIQQHSINKSATMNSLQTLNTSEVKDATVRDASKQEP
jgi:hypothetical protein